VTDIKLENMVRTRLMHYLRAANKRGLIVRTLEGNTAFWSLVS
jgi:hypothetical protein